VRRRCLWPGCYLQLAHGVDGRTLYCFAHHMALGPELQTALRDSFGTIDWLSTVQRCQAHARQTIHWRKTEVTGGSPC